MVNQESQAQTFKELEARAFAMWRVDAPDDYKRLVIVKLFDLIKRGSNQTDFKLFSDLQKEIPTLMRVEVDSAISSLCVFDVIGWFPVQANSWQNRHLNIKRKKLGTWKKYISYTKAIQPEAV